MTSAKSKINPGDCAQRNFHAHAKLESNKGTHRAELTNSNNTFDDPQFSMATSLTGSLFALNRIWSFISKKKFPIETCKPRLNKTLVALLGVDIAFNLMKNIDDIDGNSDLLSPKTREAMDLFDTGLKFIGGAVFLGVLQKDTVVTLLFMSMAAKPWGLLKAFNGAFAQWVVAPLILFGGVSLASMYAKGQINEASGKWITDLLIRKSAEPVALTTSVLSLPFDLHKHMPHVRDLHPNKTFQPNQNAAFTLIEDDLNRLSIDINNARTYGASSNNEAIRNELAHIDGALDKYEQLMEEQSLAYEQLLNLEGQKAYIKLYKGWSNCSDKEAEVAIGKALYHSMQNRNTFEQDLKPRALQFIGKSRDKLELLI
jgi:hypothetical protein